MQSVTHLVGAPGAHGIQGAEQVTQVVGGGNQPCAGQVDLAFADQVRQLRRQGKTANAHGHHECNKAGEQANQG